MNLKTGEKEGKKKRKKGEKAGNQRETHRSCEDWMNLTREKKKGKKWEKRNPRRDFATLGKLK